MTEHKTKARDRCATLVCLALCLFLALPVHGGSGLLGGGSSGRTGGMGILGLGGQAEEFLPPDQAFVFSAEAADARTIVASWSVADGYYLYRERFTFRLFAGDGEGNETELALGTPQFPRGKFKEDEFFGRMEVYYGELEVRLPLARDAVQARRVILEVGYQGCAEKGYCYPPMKARSELLLPAGSDERADLSGAAATAGAAGDGGTGFLSEQDRIARDLAEGRLWWNLLGFFGLGLLLAFTPCVFPMVPILSGLIVGRQGMNTRRAFWLSLSYVLAMALTYTAAGVLAALFGSNLQIWFQKPWVLVGFSALFVILALSMFGLYRIQMPVALQTRLSEASQRFGGGGWAGAAMLGFFSALIVGPCVAAPLAGILLYIGMSGDAWVGGLSLFVLSLGMGLPLLLFGTSAGRWLPKAGPWMETVRHVFGVLMLAVAIWLLERILPPQVTLLLWAVLLIVVAVYLGVFDRLEAGASGWRRLWKGGGVVMAVYGVVLLVGAAAGGVDPLRPLQGLWGEGLPRIQGPAGVNGNSNQTWSAGWADGIGAGETASFRPVKGPQGLDREIAAAASQGRPVMVDFYADWCIDCKRLERKTFSDPEVRRILADVVWLQVDVTDNDAQDRALLRRFGLFGPPAVLFFDRNGREMKEFRLIGFLGPEDFGRHVRKLRARMETGLS